MKSDPGTPAPKSFRDWADAKPLDDVLARAEAAVRAAPQDPGARWLIFELLCVLGRWDRALAQLRTWAALDKRFDSTAHVMRGLVAAERQRAEVFAGRVPPSQLSLAEQADTPWMSALGEALRLASEEGADAVEASDRARELALVEAPESAGTSNLQAAFAWITDSDTRLGPVCEAVIAGRYRWLAFADLTSIAKAEPASLLDLVWSEADIVLRDGTALKGYMPMRYPVQPGQRDAALLARETLWIDVGRTGVFARGQKMWTTDMGDMPVLDVRQCVFAGAANQEQDHAGS